MAAVFVFIATTGKENTYSMKNEIKKNEKVTPERSDRVALF